MLASHNLSRYVLPTRACRSRPSLSANADLLRKPFGFLRVLWTHEKKPKIIAKTYPAGFADFVLPSNRFTFNIDTGQPAKLAEEKRCWKTFAC